MKPDYASIQAPVLGLFAEKDAYVTPNAVRNLEVSMKAAGVETDFQIYPGVDHGFFNDQRREVHDPAAAPHAWSRLLAFFREHL